MRDRTAQTEPLTIGQRLVAKWEGPACEWSEPADLAEAIDNAIAAEREACARVADSWMMVGETREAEIMAKDIAYAIRKRKN